jgi:hypothetical protein
MDTSSAVPIPNTGTIGSSFHFSNNIIIIILVILLILSLFNINVFHVAGNVLEKFVEIVNPIIRLLGFTTGTILNKTTDIVSDTAKAGIDVADETINTVGDALISAGSHGNSNPSKDSLDNILNRGHNGVSNPSPTPGESSIQKPISSNKSSWCLVGEYQGTRGCIDVKDGDKCISGQIYPSQKMCLNPTMTQNASIR